MKLTLSLREGFGSIDMALDNQAFISAATATGTQPGTHIIQRFHTIARQVRQQQATGTTLHIRWVPGHEDIEGNEAADVAAKAAARGNGSKIEDLPQYLQQEALPRSKSAIIEEEDKNTIRLWKEMWRTSPRYAQQHAIDPKLPSKSFMKLTKGLPRQHAVILMQLQSGHIPLNAHLHCIQKANSPLCTNPHCQSNNRRETVQHYILKCPSYNAARHRIRRKHGRRVMQASYLLLNPDCIQDTINYIIETRRFEAMIGTKPD